MKMDIWVAVATLGWAKSKDWFVFWNHRWGKMKNKNSEKSSMYLNSKEELHIFLELEEIIQLFILDAWLGKICYSSKNGWEICLGLSWKSLWWGESSGWWGDSWEGKESWRLHGGRRMSWWGKDSGNLDGITTSEKFTDGRFPPLKLGNLSFT